MGGARTQSMTISVPFGETSDVHEYLTIKRIITQPHSPCCCEQLISTVLTNCHCGPQRPSFFSCLTESEPNISKRRCTQRQRPSFDDEPLVVASNMVNKGKKLIIEECSSNIYADEAHHYTRFKVGVLAPRNYLRLAGV